MGAFVREKDIKCNRFYREVDIFTFTDSQQQAVRRRRKTKSKITAPKQRNYNDKRAKRYFVEMANANFWKGDYMVDLTYSDEHLPATFEAAHHQAVLFLERVARRRRALGLPALKYQLVTQAGEANGRLHHHINMNGGLPREEIEAMWWAVKGTKRKNYEDAVPLGWCNVRGLQPDKKGIARRAGYMARSSSGKKLWTQSQNLIKPDEITTVTDGKFTRRELERIARLPTDCEEYRRFWERKYKGWKLVESRREYNKLTGWAFYHVFSKMDLPTLQKQRGKPK